LVDALGKKPADWKDATTGIYVDPNVMYAGKRVKGLRLKVLLRPSAPAPAPAKATATEWPEEKDDPGFDPDRND
jgi:hypothetical protein